MNVLVISLSNFFFTRNSLIKVVLCLRLNYFTLSSPIPKISRIQIVWGLLLSLTRLDSALKIPSEYLICLEITLNRFKQSSVFKQLRNHFVTHKLHQDTSKPSCKFIGETDFKTLLVAKSPANVENKPKFD